MQGCRPTEHYTPTRSASPLQRGHGEVRPADVNGACKFRARISTIASAAHATIRETDLIKKGFDRCPAAQGFLMRCAEHLGSFATIGPEVEMVPEIIVAITIPVAIRPVIVPAAVAYELPVIPIGKFSVVIYVALESRALKLQ